MHTRERLLRLLMSSQAQGLGGLTLSEMAVASKLAAPTVLAHLRKMEADRWVERFMEGRRKGYRARAVFQATWVDPGRGLFLSWQGQDFDWRWPLLSRIGDEKARLSLARLLEAAAEAGLLSLMAREGPTIICYGSVARGHAGSVSDVDVFIVHGARRPTAKAKWKDLIAQVNLSAARPIDGRVESFANLLGLPKEFREVLFQDGITVWAPPGSDDFVENQFMAAVVRGRVDG